MYLKAIIGEFTRLIEFTRLTGAHFFPGQTLYWYVNDSAKAMNLIFVVKEVMLYDKIQTAELKVGLCGSSPPSHSFYMTVNSYYISFEMSNSLYTGI